MSAVNTPNIEERLAAAAFAILTDDLPHSHDAKRWAARFMRRASHGRPTAFQRTLPPMRARERMQ